MSEQEKQSAPPCTPLNEEDIPDSVKSFLISISAGLDAAEQEGRCVVIVDRHRRYLDMTTAFADLVGYRKEELVGLRTEDLAAPNVIEDIGAYFDGVLLLRNSEGIWIYIHRSGKQLVVHYAATVLTSNAIVATIRASNHTSDSVT